jgi:hypothetical protein
MPMQAAQDAAHDWPSCRHAPCHDELMYHTISHELMSACPWQQRSCCWHAVQAPCTGLADVDHNVPPRRRMGAWSKQLVNKVNKLIPQQYRYTAGGLHWADALRQPPLRMQRDNPTAPGTSSAPDQQPTLPTQPASQLHIGTCGPATALLLQSTSHQQQCNTTTASTPLELQQGELALHMQWPLASTTSTPQKACAVSPSPKPKPEPIPPNYPCSPTPWGAPARRLAKAKRAIGQP